MARIFLMRHAKAVPIVPNMDDFDRPLEESGKRDAARIGQALRERWDLPAAIVCSCAVRTRQTFDSLGFAIEDVRFDESLFDGDAQDYVAALRASPAGSVMLIAHNPSVHNAALEFSGSGDEEARRRLAAGFPTATVAILDHPGPLASLGPGTCRLEALFSPKTLGAA